MRSSLLLSAAACVPAATLTCVCLLPGSVSAAILAPTDVPNAILWLDGDDVDGDGIAGGTLINAGVATWVDKASDNDATQATAGSQPATAAGSMNGRTTVRFASNDDLVLNEGSIADLLGAGGVTDGPNTVFAVAVSTQTNAEQRLITISNGSTSSRFVLGYNSATTDTNEIWYMSDAGFTENVSTAATITVPNIMTGRHGFNAADEAQLFVNGEFVDSALGHTDTTTATSGRIGSIDGTRFFNGDLAEIIVYDRALSELERQDVEAYLSAKWDVALVPEPGAAMLAGIAGLGLLARRRRAMARR